MAIIIRDPDVERLATEVAMIEKRTTTDAIRQALEDRLSRVRETGRETDRRANVESAILSFQRQFGIVAPTEPLTKAEEERILGIGPEGY